LNRIIKIQIADSFPLYSHDLRLSHAADILHITGFPFLVIAFSSHRISAILKTGDTSDIVKNASEMKVTDILLEVLKIRSTKS